MSRPPVEPAPDRIDPQTPRELPPLPEAEPAPQPGAPEFAPPSPSETPPGFCPLETPPPAD